MDRLDITRSTSSNNIESPEKGGILFDSSERSSLASLSPQESSLYDSNITKIIKNNNNNSNSYYYNDNDDENDNNNNNEENVELPFHVEITLARQSFRIGGVIVGTIRITPFINKATSSSSSKNHKSSERTKHQQQQPMHDDTATSTRSTDKPNTVQEIRNMIDSILLMGVGYCRYDPRWHKSNDHIQYYEEYRRKGYIPTELPDTENNENDTSPATTTGSTTNIPPDSYNNPTITSPTAATTSTIAIPIDLPIPSNDCTTPIWISSPILNMMEIPERTFGKWNDVKPQSINIDKYLSLPNDTKKDASTKNDTDDNKNNNNNKEDDESPYKNVLLEEEHIVYTFRINVPDNLPHTFLCMSCRYFYAIVVRIQLKNNNQQQQEPNESNYNTTTVNPPPYWIHLPVTLLSPFQRNQHNNTSTTTTEFDDDDNNESTNKNNNNTNGCQIMAHAVGLSCYVSAVDLHGIEDGQYTVHRNGAAALFRPVNSNTGVQSMKLMDPTSGKLACILTLIGITPLHPGSRLLLKFDFPIPASYYYDDKKRLDDDIDQSTNNNSIEQVYCYSVSSCLQGEEIVIPSKKKTTQTRAQKFLFATAHNRIDPICIESTSLDLVLPLSTPCTIQTDAVEISIQCIIDIAITDKLILSSSNATTTPKFRNIHLEIPCYVTHPPTAYEIDQYNNTTTANEDDEDDNAHPIDAEDYERIRMAERYEKEYWEIKKNSMSNNNKEVDKDEEEWVEEPIPFSFRTDDIKDDLKVLSLSMADRCNILPKAS